MPDYAKIITENQRRTAQNNRPYNPLTGEGSDALPRMPFFIPDFPPPYTSQDIPLAMYDTLPLCRELLRTGSVALYLKQKKINPTPKAIQYFTVEFIKQRIRFDFEFYAVLCLTIKDKITKQDIPFKLNRGQRKLLRELERQRLANLPIRVIVLKARQWGGSTLIQLYMLWIQLIHKKNWNSIICAHVKDAAKNIRAMYTNALSNYPAFDAKKIELKPFERTDNIKYVDGRGCRITVGSAETPNSVRSQDASMIHYSEVAFFPSTEGNRPEELIGSVSSSVPRVPLSFIAYESTAKNVGNFFHTQWLLATEGKSAFAPVFVAWLEIDIYTEPLAVPYEKFIDSMTAYEWFLWDKGATLEAIHWYRLKRAEQPNETSMKEEFPSDPVEAFQNSGRPAFNHIHIERLRKNCSPPEAVGELYADIPLSKAKLQPSVRKQIFQNIRFETSGKGLLQIWLFPDHTQKVTNRYIVSVDTGGRSLKADYSVITVLDRYWMCYGGKPEIAAQWRGHADHDILAWQAAQIAYWYNQALLIFESNTADTEKDTDTEGNHTEFIYDTISNYYTNLYSRTPADQIRQGIPAKWGFHTNRATKPLLIDNYISILREDGYIERDHEACNEARFYENKPNGSYGAIDGHHDDILISRMIALQICYELPLPVILSGNQRPSFNPIIGEASI